MNNDAFRALVNKQRSAEKSTKEIAREAVEDEFQRKRRRGGGRRGGRGHDDDGYGSDSGGSSDEDGRGGRLHGKDPKKQREEDDNLPEWKRRRREKKLQDGKGEQYRDRAKERREGNNADYASLQGLAGSGEVDRKRQAELSKYLGGDEEHTHLVKGLDKALAEKVRREEMGGGDKESGDLDQLLENAYAKKQGQLVKEAREDWQTAKPKTELGKSVLSYLLQKKSSESATPSTTLQMNSNPMIQKSIQRSMVTFSLESDVRLRKDAWEVPEISMRAFGTQDYDSSYRKMTPLNHHMIMTISRKLEEGRNRAKDRNKYNVADGEGKNASKSDNITSAGGADSKPNLEASPDKDANGNAEASRKQLDDSSDHDIFKNVGSYVPSYAMLPKSPEPEAATKSSDSAVESNGKHGATTDDHSTNNHNPTKDEHKKQSVFDNLLPETVPNQPAHNPRQQQKSRLRLNQQNSSPRKKDVIDRDIFGGHQNDVLQLSKRRGPTSAAMEGVSLSAYQGGYGEEMDVDFGGNDDGGRKGDKKKKDSGGEADGNDAGDDKDD